MFLEKVCPQINANMREYARMKKLIILSFAFIRAIRGQKMSLIIIQFKFNEMQTAKIFSVEAIL